MEILDQATAVGALNYWTGLMRIDPSQEKSAFLLMLVARKIGEYVAMGLKDVYKMRRPSQVYGRILPIIDPPGVRESKIRRAMFRWASASPK